MSIKQGGNTIAGIQGISGKANVELDNITNAGKEICANMSMPSDRYVDLTLGANETRYTAPADGWFVVSKETGTANTYLNIFNTTTSLGYTVTGPGANNFMRLACPVSKGQVIQVSYTMIGTTECFRFVYANGAQ